MMRYKIIYRPRATLEVLGESVIERDVRDQDSIGLGDPVNLPSTPLGPVNNAPVFEPRADSRSFLALEGRQWSYDFSQEFGDGDGDGLTYSFSFSNPDLVDGNSVITNSDGSLSFDLSAFEDDQIFSINVSVDDGTDVTTESFDFTAIDATGLGTLGFSNNDNNTPETLRQGGGVLGLSIFANGENKTVFLDEGVGSETFNILGDNNIIYMGDNDGFGSGHIVTIQNGAIGNTIFGGSNDDTVSIRNGNNDVFTQDGNDTAIIELGDVGTTLGDLTFDLGGNDFSWVDDFVAQRQEGVSDIVVDAAAETGDVLRLQGTGTLDLSAVATNDGEVFRGVEVIDLMTNPDAQTLDLGVQDVFRITDDNNILVIQGNSGEDFVNFDAGEGWFDTGENVTIDGDVFDVISGNNGAVTVLLDADLTAGATGL